MRRAVVGVVGVLTAWLSMVGGVGALPPPPPEEAPALVGPLMIADPDRPDEWLTEGDSNTRFAVRLPAGATCPGDTQNDNYLLQTFVVPTTADVGRLEYRDVGPSGQYQWALYSAGDDESSYNNISLFPNETVGQPGRIPEVPAVSFDVLPAGSLPAGRYHVGVACTYFTYTTRYWLAEIEIVDDAAVVPGGFRWTLVDAPVEAAQSGSSSRSGLIIVGLLAIAALALGYFVVVGRRSSASPPPSGETSPEHAKEFQ